MSHGYDLCLKRSVKPIGRMMVDGQTQWGRLVVLGIAAKYECDVDLRLLPSTRVVVHFIRIQSCECKCARVYVMHDV